MKALGIAIVPLFLLGITLLFYWPLAFTGRILGSYDLLAYFYPYRAYAAERLLRGELPLWNPYIFMGVPYLANIQTAVLYPFSLLTLPWQPPEAIAILTLVHVFLAGIFTYAFARVSLGIHPLGALLAGVAFMFSGFFSQQVGHPNQLHAAAWLPLLFLCLERSYRKHWTFGLWGGLVLALQFLAGHTQETYLSLVALGCFAFFLGWQRACREGLLTRGMWLWRVGRWAWCWIGAMIFVFGMLALMVGLGTGLAAFQLLPSYELSALSPRAGGLSYDLARSFSLPPWLILRALLPGYLDNPFSEFVGYVGFFPLALALMALWRARHHPYVWFFFLLALGALFFAFGGFNPLYPWLYRWFPGLSLFRVPARWLFLYTFAMVNLAGIGLNVFLQPSPAPSSDAEVGRFRSWLRRMPDRARWLRWAIGIVAAGVIVLTISFSHLPSDEALFLWILMGSLSLGIVFLLRPRVPDLPRVALVFVLTLAELYLAGRDLESQRPIPREAYTPLRPTVTQLLTDGSLFRLLSIAGSSYEPGDVQDLRKLYRAGLAEKTMGDFIAAIKYQEILTPNLPMTLGLSTVDGYDGGLLPLSRYVLFKQLLLETGGLSPQTLKTTDPAQPDALLRLQLGGIPDPALLGAINVKYVIADKLDDLWIENTYYDLGTSVEVASGEPLEVTPSYPLESTSLGIVSHLREGATIPQGADVARITVMGSRGERVSGTLRAGEETAQGFYVTSGVKVAHDQPAPAFPSRTTPRRFRYFTRIDFGKPMVPRQIVVEYLPAGGRLALEGMSLIDGRTLASQPLSLRPGLRLVNDGDVKVYENLFWLPRAYLVRRFEVAGEPSLAPLRDDLRQKVVLEEAPDLSEETLRRLARWEQRPSEAKAEAVTFASYEPERVRLKARLLAPAFLVLTDAFYPGWEALVDGKPAAMFRANLLFRAVFLGEGEHEVEFRYQPESLRLSFLVAAGTALGALLLAGIAGLSGWRRQRHRLQRGDLA